MFLDYLISWSSGLHLVRKAFALDVSEIWTVFMLIIALLCLVFWFTFWAIYYHQKGRLERRLRWRLFKTLSSHVQNKPVPEKRPETKLDPELWITMARSVRGGGHIMDDTPCQDSHLHINLPSGWNLAIVADGAGSARASHVGSQKATHFIWQRLLTNDLARNLAQWYNDSLPTEAAWNQFAKHVLLETYKEMKGAAKLDHYSIEDWACTIIIALYHSGGMLVAHIGDGRGAYQDLKSQWHACFTPFRGDEPNATVFITSNIWSEERIDKYLETTVISGPIQGAVFMSDGCEKYAFECSKLDTEEGKWRDPNLPFPAFLNPIKKQFNHNYHQGISTQQINQKWHEFLMKGPGFKDESDDKTMIFSIKPFPEVIIENGFDGSGPSIE